MPLSNGYISPKVRSALSCLLDSAGILTPKLLASRELDHTLSVRLETC